MRTTRGRVLASLTLFALSANFAATPDSVSSQAIAEHLHLPLAFERRSAGAQLPGKVNLTEEGLRRAFEQTLYNLDASGHGSYRGANPVHRLNLEFSAREAHLQVRDSEGTHLRVRDSEGTHLRASDPQAEVGFRLAGLGYGEDLRTPAPAKLAGAGTRVEYQRGGITEWYVNESGGLEQGFTLSQRPATASGGKPLVIALSVSGALRPVLSPEGDAVFLQAGKQTVLQYAGLHARDARGREKASRLEVKEREIRLVIEDGSAQYPLVVDPVVTWSQQAELTASDGAGGDELGFSIAVSGNTAVVGVPLRRSRTRRLGPKRVG